MSHRSLRERTLEIEKKNNKRVLCNISKYPCVFCPMCISGVCPHLKIYVETGSWNKKK